MQACASEPPSKVSIRARTGWIPKGDGRQHARATVALSQLGESSGEYEQPARDIIAAVSTA